MKAKYILCGALFLVGCGRYSAFVAVSKEKPEAESSETVVDTLANKTMQDGDHHQPNASSGNVAAATKTQETAIATTATSASSGNMAAATKTPETTKATPSPNIIQVNPKAFNAFNMWRDGIGKDILDYPPDWDYLHPPGAYRLNPSKLKPSDGGVFYLDQRIDTNSPDHFADSKQTFIRPEDAARWKIELQKNSVPTEGIKVENNVLTYPIKSGRQLSLKFTLVKGTTILHLQAAKMCKDRQLRLPTMRELFDFCAAGVSDPKWGPDWTLFRYPATARCGQAISAGFWSATLQAMMIGGYLWHSGGYTVPTERGEQDFARVITGVYCVGNP